MSLKSLVQNASHYWKKPQNVIKINLNLSIFEKPSLIKLRGLDWTAQPLPPYESRCLLLGLEVLSDRRKIAAALFFRDILCGRIESHYLADLLRFESNPYPRRRK
jgi:hypothetical protein